MRLIALSLTLTLLAACERDTRSPAPAPEPEPAPVRRTRRLQAQAHEPQRALASRSIANRGSARLTARFVAREGGVPHCGYLYSVELMLYDVVQVEQGAVDGDRIVVAQGCPEFLQARLGLDSKAPPFWVEGATYRLELGTKFPATASQRPKPWPRLDGHDVRADAIAYWAESTERVE